METKKIYIDQLISELKVSRATIYNRIKKLDIKLKKHQGKSYLNMDAAGKIKGFKRSASKPKIDNLDGLTDKIKTLEAKVKEDEQNFKILTLELGKALGKVEVLQDINQKLLLPPPSTQPEKRRFKFW